MKGDLKKNDNKHQSTFEVRRNELKGMLKNLEMKLFSNKLTIDGEKVVIPQNAEIECKLRYESDNKNVLTIKIEWNKELKKKLEKTGEDD